MQPFSNFFLITYLNLIGTVNYSLWPSSISPLFVTHSPFFYLPQKLNRSLGIEPSTLNCPQYNQLDNWELRIIIVSAVSIVCRQCLSILIWGTTVFVSPNTKCMWSPLSLYTYKNHLFTPLLLLLLLSIIHYVTLGNAAISTKQKRSSSEKTINGPIDQSIESHGI